MGRGGVYDPQMPKSAEDRASDRLREALPADEYRLYPNVRWVQRPIRTRRRATAKRTC